MLLGMIEDAGPRGVFHQPDGDTDADFSHFSAALKCRIQTLPGCLGGRRWVPSISILLLSPPGSVCQGCCLFRARAPDLLPSPKAFGLCGFFNFIFPLLIQFAVRNNFYRLKTYGSA